MSIPAPSWYSRLSCISEIRNLVDHQMQQTLSQVEMIHGVLFVIPSTFCKQNNTKNERKLLAEMTDMVICQHAVFLSLNSCLFLSLNACLFLSLSACLFLSLNSCLFLSLNACLFLSLSACLFLSLNSCLFLSLNACLFLSLNSCLFLSLNAY